MYEEYQHGAWRNVKVAGTIRAHEGTYGGGSENIVTEEIYSISSDERSSAFKKNGCDPLTHHDHFRSPCVNTQYAVRRLMPIECERLQSLPDNYTLIDHKSCSDSARYKALGNGMSQNVPNWILKRLVYYANGGEGEWQDQTSTGQQEDTSKG